METKLNFPENELARELTSLQNELGGRFIGNDGGLTDTIWIFRQLQGVTPEEWEAVASQHDFSGWLTLPLDGDAYPHLKRFQETLERLAYQTEHDALTGLANRRAFDRTLDIEMERSRRAKTPLSLAIFDLDNFKSINDTYGHPKGDEVLAAFAGKLQSSTRRYDLAARFGGEEFVLVMAGSGLIRARRLLERVLEEFRLVEFDKTDGSGTFSVSCSVGLTCYKGSVDIPADALLKLADDALYEAKTTGKDQIRISKLPFMDNVPDDTLVHADEKQFLFGGK